MAPNWMVSCAEISAGVFGSPRAARYACEATTIRRISPTWRATSVESGQMADPDREIDALFHQVDHAIRQPQVDADLRIALQIGRHDHGLTCSRPKPDRRRDHQPSAPAACARPRPSLRPPRHRRECGGPAPGSASRHRSAQPAAWSAAAAARRDGPPAPRSAASRPKATGRACAPRGQTPAGRRRRQRPAWRRYGPCDYFIRTRGQSPAGPPRRQRPAWHRSGPSNYCISAIVKCQSCRLF